MDLGASMILPKPDARDGTWADRVESAAGGSGVGVGPGSEEASVAGAGADLAAGSVEDAAGRAVDGLLLEQGECQPKINI